MSDHEFTLTPAEAEQLPDLDPDALCEICGNNAEAHTKKTATSAQLLGSIIQAAFKISARLPGISPEDLDFDVREELSEIDQKIWSLEGELEEL